MTCLPTQTIAAAILFASLLLDAALVDAADVLEKIVWTLPGTEVGDANLTDARTLIDEHGFESWFLLRTTNSNGTVASRTWARDGRYARLDASASDLFGAPIKGAVYRTQPTALAPFIAGVTRTYTIDCTMKQGELILAPGPDHAVVLGWRSPFDGRVAIRGSFNNRQTCCGNNSQVNWYVERGTAPDRKIGFKPETLAQGVSDDKVNGGISPFEMQDLEVVAGDWFYFIVDSKADGTGTPHHGDATILDLTITMTGATLPPPPEFEKDIRPLLTAH
ncbi:MAG: hypothetical protein H8E66_34910, partial [Planctomycetes bacterium]|nr:hypothetical protein [Planctomycetota bacterium]